jgi:hypothetical protein
MTHKTIKVSDTGRGRDPKNPLCDLGDYEDEYKATLISIIGKMSEWGQRKRDDGKDHYSVMSSLDVGESIGLGRGYTKHNTRDKGAGKKRNSIATVVMGQLYNYEMNKIKYPTGASVSWNQLQDFEIITEQMAGAFPDGYEAIKFVLNAFDWGH